MILDMPFLTAADPLFREARSTTALYSPRGALEDSDGRARSAAAAEAVHPLGRAAPRTLRVLTGHLAVYHPALLRPLLPSTRWIEGAPACALALEACAQVLRRPEGRRALDELLAPALGRSARPFAGRSIAALAEVWRRDARLLELPERTALLWLVARRSGPAPRPLERRIREAVVGTLAAP